MENNTQVHAIRVYDKIKIYLDHLDFKLETSEGTFIVKNNNMCTEFKSKKLESIEIFLFAYKKGWDDCFNMPK